MKNWIITFIAGLLMFSCGQQAKDVKQKHHKNASQIEQKQQQNKQQEKAARQKQQKQKKKKLPRITNDNVKKVLTEYGKKHPETIVLLKTTKGDIKIRLYKGTPLHRANFIMLANRDFYDETVFYRVEKNFIIQGGDSDDYDRRKIKHKVGYYTIPNELQPKRYYHKRGALAMAREYDDNPDKRSSSYDFFIVQGSRYNAINLDEIEKDNNIQFTQARRELYRTTGGAAHLDNQHTVFGEVIEGMAVVDSIAEVRVDGQAWPRKDISMTVEVIR